MNKTGQLFEALMARTIQPDLSKASHRQILEQVANNMLAKHLPKKNITQSELKTALQQQRDTRFLNKLHDRISYPYKDIIEHSDKKYQWEDYYKTKAYHKRIGSQRARDIAEGNTTPSIKQIYAQGEQEANRKSFKKQSAKIYDEANNQEELMRLMDDIDDTRSSYIVDELNPDERMMDGIAKVSKRSETSDEEALLDYMNLLSLAHVREPYALSRVKNAKEGSNLYKARELYRALYTSKLPTDKRRLRNIIGISKRY